MRGAMLAVTLLAPAALAGQPVRLALMRPSLVDVDEARGAYFVEHLANAMATAALRVVTPRELVALLGVERQKELLGCTSDSASCLAELGGAIGAEGVVLVEIAHFGNVFRADLKVIEPRTGAPLAVESLKTEQEDELAELLEKAGRRLATRVLASLRPAEEPRTARSVSWLPAAVAAAALGTGLVFWLSGADAGSHLSNGEVWTNAQGLQWRDLANTRASISVGLLAAGSALALAALAMLIFGGE